VSNLQLFLDIIWWFHDYVCGNWRITFCFTNKPCNNDYGEYGESSSCCLANKSTNRTSCPVDTAVLLMGNKCGHKDKEKIHSLFFTIARWKNTEQFLFCELTVNNDCIALYMAPSLYANRNTSSQNAYNFKR
jgi:hypothetical protein